jgi:hypothetical protein
LRRGSFPAKDYTFKEYDKTNSMHESFLASCPNNEIARNFIDCQDNHIDENSNKIYFCHLISSNENEEYIGLSSICFEGSEKVDIVINFVDSKTKVQEYANVLNTILSSISKTVIINRRPFRGEAHIGVSPEDIFLYSQIRFIEDEKDPRYIPIKVNFYQKESPKHRRFVQSIFPNERPKTKIKDIAA